MEKDIDASNKELTEKVDKKDADESKLFEARLLAAEEQKALEVLEADDVDRLHSCYVYNKNPLVVKTIKTIVKQTRTKN